MQLVTRHTSV